jgi:hypothetical protein
MLLDLDSGKALVTEGNMSKRGICKLCGDEKSLQESHYIPAALYPKAQKLQYATRIGAGVVVEHMKAPLLCSDCEKRFDRNGESEVLRHVAPKSSKRFPLHEQLRLALPREADSSISRFAGYDVGLDMDKFAYFMLSVVWRGAVHQWTFPDGNVAPQIALGAFEQPIRLYLLGKAPLPPDTAVIVIVCSDKEARKTWITPSTHVEAICLNFRFLTRGVFFRAMMGRHLPQYFRDRCCTSPRKCVFYADVSHRMPEISQIFDVHAGG